MKFKKLLVRNSVKNRENGQVYIEYAITKENESGEEINYTLRFGFENEYAEYICDEVADGVMVMLIPYAIRGGYDIESLVPVTEELYYRLLYQLIPQLSICAGYREIKIECVKIQPDWKPYAVAAAMSCGVDSFATFFEYSGDDILDDYKITHLTFFQNGAHHSGQIGHSENEGEVFKSQLNHVKKYCQEYSRELIVVTSNMDEILSKMFWEDSYDRTHTYRNMGVVLMLQKLIKIYYYSPAYNADNFKCSFEQDSAMYERLILPNVSSKYTCFYNSNGSMTRIEKIKYISSFEETHNNLLVCYKDGKNCGKCIKCRRTLLELYYSGNLDKYDSCFPTDQFYKRKLYYITWMLSKRHNDPLLREIVDYTKEKYIRIPIYQYVLADLRFIIAAVLRLFRKIVRK